MKYLALFKEFHWPSAFPLPKSQFGDFLRRHSALREESHYSDEQRYIDIWYKLKNAWYESSTEREGFPLDESSSDDQRLQLLDQKICEALRYEEERADDMAYATATGGEIAQRLKAPTRLHDSANIGHDWRIDVTAEDIMERFWDVTALKPELGSMELDDSLTNTFLSKMKDRLEEMGKVMEAAYHRYLDPEEAEREARMVGVPDEDDDSTSDFELDDSDEDGSSSSSNSTEDANGDLEITALQTDMDIDVEEIREEMATSQVSISDTQASSQILRDIESDCDGQTV